MGFDNTVRNFQSFRLPSNKPPVRSRQQVSKFHSRRWWSIRITQKIIRSAWRRVLSLILDRLWPVSPCMRPVMEASYERTNLSRSSVQCSPLGAGQISPALAGLGKESPAQSCKPWGNRGYLNKTGAQEPGMDLSLSNCQYYSRELKMKLLFVQARCWQNGGTESPVAGTGPMIFMAAKPPCNP
jgi:hypothetical protein